MARPRITVLASLLLVCLSPQTTKAQAREEENFARQQGKLWQAMMELRAQDKFAEALVPLEKMVRLHREAFGNASYTLAFLEDLSRDLENRRDNKNHGNSNRGIWIRCILDSHDRTDTLEEDKQKAARLQRCLKLEGALDLRRQTFGENHLWTMLGWMDLARQRQKTGKLREAAQAWESALPLLTELLSEKSKTDYWIKRLLVNCLVDTRRQLARLRLRDGQAVEAENLIAQNLKTVSDCPKVWDWCVRAELLLAKGDVAATASLPWGEMIAQSSGLTVNASHELSEMEHFQFAAVMHRVLDYYFSFRALSGKSGTVEPHAFGISNFKGSVFIEQSRRHSERRNPKLAPLYDELDATNRSLSILFAPTGDGTPPAGTNADEAQELLKRRAKLEVELAQIRLHLPIYMNPPAWMQLPAGVVLLEFYEYDRYGPRSDKQESAPARGLACLVCRNLKKEAVLHVDLGPAAPVAAAVRRWRSAIQAGGGIDRGAEREKETTDENPDAQHVVRKLVWEPLTPYVKDATRVLLSPDGVLAFAPFAALPGSQPGKLLLEEHALAYVPVPHLLTPFRSKTTSVPKLDKGPSANAAKEHSRKMLLIGGVDFEGAKDAASPDRPAGRPGLHFKPLPGTIQEVRLVEKLFKKSFPQGDLSLLQGEQATKEAFRREAPTHRWIHVATHGFFLPQPGNPLAVGSGLALAGANSRQAKTAAEGLLMTLEVAGMDLGDVDLVVLSACETSLGDVQRGEGVRGLQMGFQVAGAKTIVSTLWPVHDQATQALMIEFYRNLWERKLGKLESLRRAQLSMLNGELFRAPSPASSSPKTQRQSPYYWAAFVLSGDGG